MRYCLSEINIFFSQNFRKIEISNSPLIRYSKRMIFFYFILIAASVRNVLEPGCIVLVIGRGNPARFKLNCCFKIYAKNLGTNRNFGKNPNFVQKSKFCSRIEILVKNRNFGQKTKFWSIIQVLFKNRNFGQKSKFLVENRNFGQKSKFESLNKKHICIRSKSTTCGFVVATSAPIYNTSGTCTE